MYNVISEFKFSMPLFLFFFFLHDCKTLLLYNTIQLLQNPRDTCLFYTYIRRTVFVFQNGKWKTSGKGRRGLKLRRSGEVIRTALLADFL